MRVAFQYQAIFERARFAFIRVTDHVLLLAGSLGHEAPFEPGGEAGSAAALQPGLLDHIDHLRGGHLTKRSPQRGVAIVGDVIFNAGRVDQPGVLQNDALLGGHGAFSR